MVKAVEQNNRRFSAAVVRGDARAMASAYADDAELLPPNAEALRGRDDIERFWRGGIEMGIRSVELETLELRQADGFAFEVGRYTLRIEQDGGEPVTDVGKYVIVHRRGPDGTWRRAVEMFNWSAPCPGEREFGGRARTTTQASTAEQIDAAVEIEVSRARIVEAADEARRRLELDLHDGAQERLVLAALTLRRAQARARGTPAEAFVAEALEQLQDGLAKLSELARGLHPAVLSDHGLAVALEGLVARSPVPVDMRVTPERVAPAAEAAIYFAVAEALTNVAKHARATRAKVSAATDDGFLTLEVRDDGVGAADPDGHGLRGIADRVDALGGLFRIDSSAGDGTVLTARLPLSTR
jgi:signal transduction histidine kinase